MEVTPSVAQIPCNCGGFYRTIAWPCGCTDYWMEHRQGCTDPRNISLPAAKRCGKPGKPCTHMTIEEIDPGFHGC